MISIFLAVAGFLLLVFVKKAQNMMIQPALYVGGGALAFGLMQPAPAQPGVLVTIDWMVFAGAVVLAAGGVGSVVVQIINARANAKERELAATERAKLELHQQAAAATAALTVLAAESAAVLSQKNLDKTEEVAVKVNGHWSDIEKRLNDADKKNNELVEAIKVLTATLAIAHKDTAVALTEKAAGERAAQVKELADARAAYPVPVTTAPAPPSVAPASIATVTEAAKTISDAVPQLTSIEETGENTNAVVKEIEKKP